MRLSKLLQGWRDGLRLALASRRRSAAPDASGADCPAVLGMREVDHQVMAQLGRAVGLSERSAMSLIEQVTGLRERSASLIRYLEHAHVQSEAMQDGIELNSRIISELAAFVRTLPQQIANERNQFQQLMVEVKKLSDMTDTIRGIARQTEILAINAAIEAARSGEGGRGFAVLAGEMRHLATQSNASATKVNNDIQSLLKTVEVSYSGEFEARTLHNEAEAERLGHLTLKLDESYVDMRQFYQMLLTAVSEHNSELDVGIAALLGTAQYQDIFKQIIDRAQPALDSRHAVMAELIRRLRAGERDTGAVDAKAQTLAADYLALEAAHHDPEPAAGTAAEDPADRVVFF